MNESVPRRPGALLALLLALALAACSARAGGAAARGREHGRAVHPDRPERPPGQRPRFRRQVPDRLFRLHLLPGRLPGRPAGDRRRAAPVRGERAGARRAGPADLHQRRSRPRHAAGAAPVRRRLPPAADRPDRQRGGDRPGRPRLPGLLRARRARRRRRLHGQPHAGWRCSTGPRASRSRSSRTTRAPAGVAAELERWVR